MADFGAELDEASATRRPPVIMVHGALVGGWCFDDFRIPFEAQGFDVQAPDLPGHGSGGEDVRGRSIRDYVKATVAQIAACAEPPILIGHSMGGLVAQLAASRAKVAALVLLAPSPPWGQPISSPMEGAAALGLYSQGAYWLDVVRPDWGVCRACTLDRLGPAEARAIYARMIPESGRALFEVLNWWLDPTMATLVPANGIKAPVLALTGEHDRIHPSATVKAVAARLGGAFRELPGLSHWTMGGAGSSDAADAVLSWLYEVGVGRGALAAV